MTEILQAIEEIGAAEMTGKPVGDRVEQLLKKQESPADVQAILNALPPSVARSHFLPILENKDTKNRAEIAKAYANFIHEVSFSDPRKAYLVMYEALSTNPAYTAEAHTFLIKYLQTYTQMSELGSNADTHAKAVSAIVNSLSLPLWQFDEVADLLPVRALRTSAVEEHKVAHALLQAFTTNCNFSNFKNATQDNNHELIVKRWGLNLDVLTEKIRLLLLCKLAHDHPGEPITYKAVSSALEVPESEVEDFVVKAISKKLLVAKIDQVSQSITISYAHHATFNVDQWRQLKDTLEHWQLQLARLSQ